MEEYVLYLDETSTHTNNSQRVFSVAGVIIKKADIPQSEAGLNAIKNIVWAGEPNPSSIVLHEKDVKDAHLKNRHLVKPHYRRFKNNQNRQQLYDEMRKLFNTGLFTIVGACVVEDELKSHYHADITTDQYLIAMQILIENFCHFLQVNNGIGEIILESRESQDKIVRMHFSQIMALGTMYITPYAVQERISSIRFVEKTQNLAGLQIADFVPNPFARNAGNKTQYQFSLYNDLKRWRYDGGIHKRYRYGVKYLP